MSQRGAPVTPKLDEAYVCRRAGKVFFERGQRYFASGAVSQLDARPDSVSALVQGTDEYKVGIWREEDGFEHECDCPVGLDGKFCKHCVAVALAWIAENKSRKNSGKGKTKASLLEKYLMGLETAALVTMLLERAAKDKLFAQRLKMQAAKQDLGGQGQKAMIDGFRKLLDNAIKRRGYVDYDKMRAYARQIKDVAEAIAGLLHDGHAITVRELAEYALELLEEAFNHVDDSNGHMMRLMETFQDLHHAACEAAPPDPVELAEMLFEKESISQSDTFHGALKTYAKLLGETGIVAYRALAEKEWDKLPPLGMGEVARTRNLERNNITRIMEGLAEVTGDVEAVIAIKKKDLSSTYAYYNIAMIYSEAGEDDKALDWAEQGVKVSPRADERLNTFLIAAYQKRGRHKEAIAIAWEAFRSWASLEKYKEVKRCVDFTSEWSAWREKSLAWVREWNRSHPNSNYAYTEATVLIDIFLWEGREEEAWQQAVQYSCYQHQWMTLAKLREASHPLDAIAVYQRLLEPAIRLSNYAEAVGLLVRIDSLKTATGKPEEFAALLSNIRMQHKQKRKLMAMMQDKGW